MIPDRLSDRCLKGLRRLEQTDSQPMDRSKCSEVLPDQAQSFYADDGCRPEDTRSARCSLRPRYWRATRDGLRPFENGERSRPVDRILLAIGVHLFRRRAPGASQGQYGNLPPGLLLLPG